MYPEIDLDAQSYERGIEARRATQEALSDVPDILDTTSNRRPTRSSKLLAALDAEVS